MNKPTETCYTFPTHTAAWSFFRDSVSVVRAAGYPSLDGRNSVRVIPRGSGALVDALVARHGGSELIE
jgi:hypothetical protein